MPRVSNAALAILTPAQCRAARALLDWDQNTLMARTGVHRTTIIAFESGTHMITRTTAEKLRACFAAEGVRLVTEGDEVGAMVRVG